jgi:hypothetical protein
MRDQILTALGGALLLGGAAMAGWPLVSRDFNNYAKTCHRREPVSAVCSMVGDPRGDGPHVLHHAALPFVSIFAVGLGGYALGRRKGGFSL